MAIRMMSGLPARVIEVLVDYLPAELDLIDVEESDGIQTPDIEPEDYYEWDQKFIAEYPACTIRTVSSTPFEIPPLAQRLDAEHRLELRFHATLANAASDPAMLQKLMHRYVAGAARVLCVLKNVLQTAADNTAFVEIVTWGAEATYGPEEAQEDGAIVRSATLPIDVRRREAR